MHDFPMSMGLPRVSGYPLTNDVCTPCFKAIPSFSCVVTPSKHLAARQPLKVASPLGNRGALRKGRDSGRTGTGTVARGKEEGEKDAQKVLRICCLSKLTNMRVTATVTRTLVIPKERPALDL